MGHRNAPRTEPNCSSRMQKKEKTEGVGVGGCWLEEEEKLFLSVQFLQRFWRITQPFGGGGHSRGAKKKTHPERAEVSRHSGPYRKVTFERTIARLSGHICWMNEA